MATVAQLQAQLSTALHAGDYSLAAQTQDALKAANQVQSGSVEFQDLSADALAGLSSTYGRRVSAAAVADTVLLNDGQMTAGSNVLTSPSGPFVPSDATAQKQVHMDKAGAAGGNLGGYIATYLSPTQVQLNSAAVTTATGVSVLYGTDNTAAINAATDAAYAAGGGVVTLNPATKPYMVRRKTTGVQGGGGIALRRGVSFDGNGATLALADNNDFFWVNGVLSGNTAITANVTQGDTNLTVTSSAGFAVGDAVLVQLGDAAYDGTEPDYWWFALVSAVPDGTHVTVDKPAPAAVTVAGKTHKHVNRVSELIENQFIQNVTLLNYQLGGASCESGINLRYAKNFFVRNVSGSNVGPGVVRGQYVDGLRIDNAGATKCLAFGDAAKGRVFTLSECNSVLATNVYGENFGRSFVIAEARCDNVVFEGVRLANTYASRTNDSSNPLFYSLGNSPIKAKNVQVSGRGAWLSLVGDLSTRVEDLIFQCSSAPSIDQLQCVTGRLSINGSEYVGPDRRRFSRTFRLLPSSTIQVFFPSGLLTKLRVRVSTLTGITYAYVLSGAGSSGPIHGQFVAGQNINITTGGAVGYDATYNANNDTAKSIVITTDGTAPADAWAVIEADIQTVTADDTGRGLHSGKDYIGLESPPTVSGSRGGNAALASLITTLVNLGIVIDGSS